MEGHNNTNPCYSKGKIIPQNKIISIPSWGLLDFWTLLEYQNLVLPWFNFSYSRALGKSYFGIPVVFHIHDFGMISWYFTIYYWATKSTFWSLIFAQVIPKFGIFIPFLVQRLQLVKKRKWSICNSQIYSPDDSMLFLVIFFTTTNAFVIDGLCLKFLKILKNNKIEK